MNSFPSKNPGLFCRTLLTRLLYLLVFAACSFAHAPQTFAQNPTSASPISADSDKLLHRLFASPDFEPKIFGPARWLDDGQFYTTVEPSATNKDAQDIVRYETATGKREILVSAAKLIPPGGQSPLA